jgi:nuclear protein localization family protein 4
MQAPSSSTSYLVRVQSKDGTERYTVTSTDRIAQLHAQIEHKLGVPVNQQTLSLDRQFKEVLRPETTIGAANIRHGQMLYLNYTGERPQTEEKRKLRDIKRQWDLKSYMDHLDSQGLVFKNQDYTHCKSAAIDYDSCDVFQSYLQKFAFRRQRVGYLYGKFDAEGKVTIDFIYEPPQETSSESFILLDNKQEMENVETIASHLGYQKVGWILAHPPERDYILSSNEVLKATELQAEAIAKFPDRGQYFVTFKVTVTEEEMSHFEAFQVTDQAIKLFQAKLFEPTNDPKLCRVAEEVLMARQGVGRKDSKEIDPTVFLKPVAVVGDYRGTLRTAFIIENREDEPQSKQRLKEHLMNRKTVPFLTILSDFHLLLFLANTYLSPTTDIPALCDAIRKGDRQVVDTFKYLIESHVGLS